MTVATVMHRSCGSRHHLKAASARPTKMHTRTQSVTQHIHLLRPIGASAVVAAQAPLPTYSIPAPSFLYYYCYYHGR